MERVGNLCNWDSEWRVEVAYNKLRGDADIWGRAKRKKIKTWGDFKQLFNQRFANSKRQLRRELTSCKQRYEECVRAYTDRFEGLYARLGLNVEDDDHMYCTCAVPEPVHMMDTGAHIRRVWPNTGKNRRTGTGARGKRNSKFNYAKTGPKAMMQTPGMGSQPMYMAQPMMYAPATAQQPIMYAPAMGAPVVSQGMVPMHYVYQ
jgi:hypothetical protein